MRATSSWSRDSERVVNPTRSANRTVTVRRSSVIAPTVSGLPQYPQNRKRSGLSSRHLGQINTAKGWVPILEKWDAGRGQHVESTRHVTPYARFASLGITHYRSHGRSFERGSLCQPAERAGQAVQDDSNGSQPGRGSPTVSPT